MALQATPPGPSKGMSPQQYYITLVHQGYPSPTAMQSVNQHYGPPQTRQQREQDAKNSGTAGQVAAGVGMVGGAIATRYVMDNAGKWIDTLTGKNVTEQVVKNSGQNISAAGQAATPTTQSSWNALGDAQTQAQSVSTELSGKTTVVDTPAGKQSIPVEAKNDPGFMKSANWDAIGSGALSALAAYQAYRAYKSGDKIGAGISGATAASLAAQTAISSGAGFAGAQTAAAAAPYLGAAAGAYQGYQTAKMIGDSAAGSQRTKQGVVGGASSGALIGGSIGSVVPGVGTAVGAAVGAVVGGLAGAVGSWTGSHKGKAQFMRDNIRGVLKENGVLDKDYQGTLADGSKFDFGQDGSHLKWKNIDKIAAEKPNAWGKAVDLGGALAASYGFVGQKNSDIAAWYARGAVSNAGDDPNVAAKNMQHFAQQQGITLDLVKSKLDQAIADNRISQAQYDSYLNGAKQLTAGVNPQAGATVIAPKAGEVTRVSPGMYMNDKGQVSRASSMRQALENNYGKKEKK